MTTILEDLLPRQERTTMAENIYEDIKQLLLSGAIPPGEKLTLRGLADIFGASPMPVRDAVARLVIEGALEMLPNRSVRVFKPSLAEFREIVTLRCCLEGLATACATERLDDETLARIAECVERYEQAGHQEKINTEFVIASNRELHFTLYRVCEMPRLVSMIENIWTQIAPLFALSMSIQERGTEHWESFGHHRRLLEALMRRDPEAARQAVVDDIRDAAIYIESVQVFKEHRER